MAIRLNVVMEHTPLANPKAQSVGESVVGELIGRPGIDMTLVGRLDSIAPDSTDWLSLESLTGDVAVLGWQDQADLMQTLSGIGFDGARSVHANDPGGLSQPSGRRIYAFDLRQFDHGKQVCDAMINLQQSRQVKVVSLGMNPPLAKPPQSDLINETPTISSVVPASITDPQPISKPKSGASKQTPDIPKHSVDLDDLVDQLDELDP